MNYKSIKIVIVVVISFFITIKLSYCKGYKASAPLGIHGQYAFPKDSIVYLVNDINRDTFLSILMRNNLEIKSGRLNNYDAPWDSLKYLISNIPCGAQNIEACIKFTDKKAINSTFEILWFNAPPTNDDVEYYNVTKKYYECFENILHKNNLIK